MPGLLNWLTDGFMPHGYCLRWDGPLLFVYIAGNLGIAIAYFLIPTALRVFVGKRKDLPYPYMFQLFAAFILSCGVTHLIKIWVLYQPVYWLEAAIDMWTAGVSLVTAALLVPLIPKALQLRSAKELEEANTKLAAEVEERKKAEEEARAARDEAVRANQLKSQFVANVSHEVRTPMSGIIGLMEVLLLSEGLDTDTREISEKVFVASKKLLSVLNDLLDFSKLEAGRIELSELPFSVKSAIAEVISFTEAAAKEKGLKLSTRIGDDVPDHVLGDGDKITHTLLNFVHNAVKFTDNGGVTVDVSTQPGASDGRVRIRFAVIDTGIGIAEESKPFLFQPFVQADGTIRRRFGGTGLGLSIAKRFVELMGGTIGFDSELEDGSTFWFVVDLPRVGHES